VRNVDGKRRVVEGRKKKEKRKKAQVDMLHVHMYIRAQYC